jgi:hypothetical protein
VFLRSAFERWGLEIPADLADLVDDPQTKEAAHPTEASPGSRNVQARPI